MSTYRETFARLGVWAARAMANDPEFGGRNQMTTTQVEEMRKALKSIAEDCPRSEKCNDYDPLAHAYHEIAREALATFDKEME